MTQIVVLAAGQGTRLRPYSEQLPKTLVPLNGTPMFELQLAVFKQLNVTDITVVKGYQGQCFEQYAVKQVVNDEFASSNMVYSLMCALDSVDENQDLVVSYGDIVYQPEVLHGLMQAQGEVVVTADLDWHDLWSLRMPDPLSDAETFEFDEQHSVLSLGQKPEKLAQIQAQYIGLIKFDKTIVKSLKGLYQEYTKCLSEHRAKNLYFTDFIQAMIKDDKEVKSYFIQRGWLETDSVEDLEIYQTLLRQEQYQILGFNPEFLK